MTSDQAHVIERIGSYIRHNATKEPAALRALVERGHAELVASFDGLSPAQATFQPAPNVWSVLQVLDHVVTAKLGVARICARLARGDVPPGFGREGDEQAQDGVTITHFTSLADAGAAAQAAHEALLAFIDAIDSATNTEARFAHFLFGPLNCREWAAFQRVHDGDHTGQIGQVRSAPGFPVA
jgi:uncharacterized damage-inducible protein DinB